jgi:hypothetical protein
MINHQILWKILWKQIACVCTKVNYTKPTIYVV